MLLNPFSELECEKNQLIVFLPRRVRKTQNTHKEHVQFYLYLV